MRATSVALFCCILMAGTSGLLAGETAPYEAMRNLQALQDRIATGNALAEAAHAKAILRTAQVFEKAKPEIWRDKRNAQALVMYLFSGGDAAKIANAITPDMVAPETKALYEGALAYGSGDDIAARSYLMSIDPKGLANGLGGHLALIQATLIASDDEAKAIALLDIARLLEPGTLVEEAALRKEMSLIGSVGDLDKFTLLARRYLNAFPRSTYAGNFRQLVAKAANQLGAGNSPEAAAKLAQLMAALVRAERRRLYLAISREALISGRMTMAAIAGTEARQLATRSDPDEGRAMLYYGAATIVGPHYDDGIAALVAVSPDQLDGRDRALRASALAVADLIRRPATSDQDADPKGQSQATLAADVERSLSAAEAVLKEPSK